MRSRSCHPDRPMSRSPSPRHNYRRHVLWQEPILGPFLLCPNDAQHQQENRPGIDLLLFQQSSLLCCTDGTLTEDCGRKEKFVWGFDWPSEGQHPEVRRSLDILGILGSCRRYSTCGRMTTNSPAPNPWPHLPHTDLTSCPSSADLNM